MFARLPRALDSDALAALLRRRYSTLVVPGRFFEMPRYIRFSFGVRPERLAQGLRNLSRALDDLQRIQARSPAAPPVLRPSER